MGRARVTKQVCKRQVRAKSAIAHCASLLPPWWRWTLFNNHVLVVVDDVTDARRFGTASDIALERHELSSL